MIRTASYRICLIDGLPVQESKVFQALLRFNGVRAAVKATTRVTLDFEEIQRSGSDELKQIIDAIGYLPPAKRSEAS